MRQLLGELKRRHVYRVAISYLVAAFVVVQLASLAADAFGLPSWFEPMVWVLCGLGFPLALVLAWAFELTPEGVRRTSAAADEGGADLSRTSDVAHGQTRRAVKTLVGVGVVAAAALAGWHLAEGGDVAESGDDPSSRTPAATEANPGGDESPDRSIAVLPFENLSGARDAEPFVKGIHDDLLTQLSNVADLEVISRTSVRRFGSTNLGLPAIADSLGVRWIVEGGVQQVGDRVQVNAQLVHAEEDTRRWAESYRRELTAENLFAVQSELTRRITRSLHARVTMDEERRLARRPTRDLEAYRLFAQGRGLLEQRAADGMRTAIEHFRRALRRDSMFAPAWAALGEAHTLLGNYGHAPPDSVFPPAWRATRRALDLDPDLADAHAAAGLLHLNHHEGPAALRELATAVQLSPSLARAHRWLGVALQVLGRPGALPHYRRAVDLDPMSPEGHADLAGALLEEARLEEALRHARRARSIEPRYTLGRRLEINALRRLGRLEEAESLARAEGGLSAEMVSELAVIRVAAGDTAGARELLARLRDAGDPYDLGVLHAALGEEEKACRAFDRVASWDIGRVIGARGFSGSVARMRDAPCYRELIRKINLAWGLNPDGFLPDSVDVSLGPPTGKG